MTKENISLKEYFDQKFDLMQEYMNTRFNSIDKSTVLAQQGLDARLESMNEFRSQMKDQTGTFITRTEHLAMMQRYDMCIENLTIAASKNDGMASQKSVTVAFVIAAIGIFIGIIDLIFRSI